MKIGFTYIMTNKNNSVLYTEVTTNILQRVYQHKTKHYPDSFTSRYNCNRLVFYTKFDSILEAIEFENKIKAGNRNKKEKLVESENSEWLDLAEDWLFQF